MFNLLLSILVFISSAFSTMPAKIEKANEEIKYGNIGSRLVAEKEAAITLISVKRAIYKKYDKPKSTNHELLEIEMLIENLRNGERNFNPFYATIKDTDGFNYEPTSLGDKGVESATSLSKGEKIRFFTTYEIPKGSKNYILKYDDRDAIALFKFE